MWKPRQRRPDGGHYQMPTCGGSLFHYGWGKLMALIVRPTWEKERKGERKKFIRF